MTHKSKLSIKGLFFNIKDPKKILKHHRPTEKYDIIKENCRHNWFDVLYYFLVFHFL